MSTMHFEITTSSDMPGEFTVVGIRSGRAYGTHKSMNAAKVEVELLERRLLIRKRVKAEVLEAIESDETDGLGWCLACGEPHYEVEPDARGYTCESCGAPKVFGIEELAMEVC